MSTSFDGIKYLSVSREDGKFSILDIDSFLENCAVEKFEEVPESEFGTMYPWSDYSR